MKSKIIFFIAVVFWGYSCNFLDIVPDDKPTFEDAFKNEQTLEGYVYSCYSFMPWANNFRTNFSWAMSNEFVASYHWGAQYFSFLQITQGMHNASNPVLDVWQDMNKGIRQCYMFFENVDNVRPVVMQPAEFEGRKKIWKAEINFLIAYYHYILLQNYGPVVIIDKTIPIDGSKEDLFRSRSSYDESVEKIAKMFDVAITDLPDKWSRADYGRPTKSVAQALKSRMYLYAASPLFNGNTDYANFKNKDGKLLMSQVYDHEKWNKALQETKKAIDMAHAQGYKLYEYNKEPIANAFDKAVLTARWKMVDPWNSELIWGYSANKEVATNLVPSFQQLAIPRGFNNGSPPAGGMGASMTAVELFYDKYGKPMEGTPAWENRMNIVETEDATGEPNHTIQFHNDREARFYAFIGYDGGPYELNDDVYVLDMLFRKPRPLMIRNKHVYAGSDDLNQDQIYSGYACKKGVHPSSNAVGSTFTIKPYPFPLIRLGELYLNYAEAAANYLGSLDNDAKKYLDDIRATVALPSFETSYGALSGGDLIKAVKRERMIEMMFEGHWLYDLKRWKDAKEWFAKDRQNMWGLNTAGGTKETFYHGKDAPGTVQFPTPLINRPYIFDDKHNFYPIKQTYVDVNHNLVQNPGW